MIPGYHTTCKIKRFGGPATAPLFSRKAARPTAARRAGIHAERSVGRWFGGRLGRECGGGGRAGGQSPVWPSGDTPCPWICRYPSSASACNLTAPACGAVIGRDCPGPDTCARGTLACHVSEGQGKDQISTRWKASPANVMSRCRGSVK